MATVNLGRIKPVWQGTWNSSTQYLADDIVYYGNSAWIAVATNTNSAPADGNANWDKMSQGLSANSVTAAELADGAVTAAKIDSNVQLSKVLQIVQGQYAGHDNYSSPTYAATNIAASITPIKADSKFLIQANVFFSYAGNHDTVFNGNFYDSINPAGSTSSIAPTNTSGAGSNRTGTYFGMGSFAAAGTVDDWGVFNISGNYLYTPSYQNTNARTIGVLLAHNNNSSGGGSTIRLNMPQTNSDDGRDIRGYSTITITEIAA